MGGPVKVDDTKSERNALLHSRHLNGILQFANFFSLSFRRCCCRRRHRRHRRLVNFQSMSTVCERARDILSHGGKKSQQHQHSSDTQLLFAAH